MNNNFALTFRKQEKQPNEKQLGLDSDDDSEREESSKSFGKGPPRRSLAIQSGHKVKYNENSYRDQYNFFYDSNILKPTLYFT